MLHTLCCPFGIIYTSLHNDMINTKISAKAFFSYESKNRFSFLALAICMPIILLAKNIDISSWLARALCQCYTIRSQLLFDWR